MCSRGKTGRITTCRSRWEIYKQFQEKQQDFLFSWHRGWPYPWKVNRRSEASFIYSQSCSLFVFGAFFFSPPRPRRTTRHPSSAPLRSGWLRRYLESLTLCVNIAYNVTLNMQIGTAQHLISHLSVKVPSVGSPGGPRSDVTASARQKHAKRREATRGERKEERGAREVKALTLGMFSHKELLRPKLLKLIQKVEITKWCKWKLYPPPQMERFRYCLDSDHVSFCQTAHRMAKTWNLIWANHQFHHIQADQSDLVLRCHLSANRFTLQGWRKLLPKPVGSRVKPRCPPRKPPVSCFYFFCHFFFFVVFFSVFFFF